MTHSFIVEAGFKAGRCHFYSYDFHPCESVPRCWLIFHCFIVEGVFKAGQCFLRRVSEIVVQASRCYYFADISQFIVEAVFKAGRCHFYCHGSPPSESVIILWLIFYSFIVNGVLSPGRRFPLLWSSLSPRRVGATTMVGFFKV